MLRKYFIIYPQIEIEGITMEQACIMETGCKKLSMIEENRTGEDSCISCYSYKIYGKESYRFVIGINEALTKSKTKNWSIVNSYIRMRIWEEKIDKIMHELMEAAGVTS